MTDFVNVSNSDGFFTDGFDSFGAFIFELLNIFDYRLREMKICES